MSAQRNSTLATAKGFDEEFGTQLEGLVAEFKKQFQSSAEAEG